MELKTNHDEDQKPISVLQGDGFCTSRFLARESSLGQSSRIFYRASEGVPFKWEMQPGTPKNPQKEDDIPPLCPSPLMQSLGLPLPNVHDHDETNKESALKKSKIWSLKKMVKKRINDDISKKVESSRFGDLISFSSDSSYCPSSSFSSNSRVVDVSTVDGPFCCSPCNVPAILDEGNTRIYYCSQHKKAFAIEEDGSFLGRILSRDSTADHFSGPFQNEITPTGIPFRWETQPGTPKSPPENDIIPPPIPPPAAQSLSLPRPRRQDGGEKAEGSMWGKALFWIRRKNKKKGDEKIECEMSFRYHENMEICSSNEEFDASLSSVSRLSKGAWRVSKMGRSLQGGYFSCGGSWSRRDILVFVRRKLK